MHIIPLMYSVKEYVDLNLKSDVGNVTNLPHCDANFETSVFSMCTSTPSHPPSPHPSPPQGMESPPLTEYKAERGLQEVLCKIDGTYRSLDDMSEVAREISIYWWYVTMQHGTRRRCP